MRILIKVAYDGTIYHGWQFQPGSTTIEGILNSELSSLTGEDIRVIGASRTDAGVHSLGTVAVFDTGTKIPPSGFLKALNGSLPEDIRIVDASEVDKDFHPRHCNSQKTYCYRIFQGDVCLPQYRLYCHHIYGNLDLEAMNNACTAFIGQHDFAGFCAVGSQSETTVRTVYDLHIETDEVTGGRFINIYVTGSGFLYNMVRIIAGTLLETGRGRIDCSDMKDIIDACDRSKAGPTLPARGLTLVKYDFEGL